MRRIRRLALCSACLLWTWRTASLARAAASAVGSEEFLAAAGLALEASPQGLQVAGALADSSASRLGLRPGDKLLYLNGRKTQSLSDAAEALAAWAPGTRLWALVERALQTESLSTSLPAPAAPAPRSAAALTPGEERLRDAQLASVDRDVPDRVKRLRTPEFRIPSGEHVWIRFPKGIPALLSSGDALEGVTSTAMATDATLDFVAIPAGSSVWTQVLSVTDSYGTKLIKLHVYKIRLKNGHTYPCSGLVTDVSGDQGLLKVSAGGTIVAAAPPGKSPYLADPERSFQIWFLRPLTIHEADSFFTSGPGLWLKTSGETGRKAFEVTHVIAKRSADVAGIKVGDIVESVGGGSAAKLNFSEAIDRLYGRPGSPVRLRVRHADQGSSEEVSLLRGVMYHKGVGLGFSRQSDSSVAVTRVYPESSAERAGVRAGDALLSVGPLDLRQMDDLRLNEMLKVGLTGGNELTCQTPGRQPRKVSLPAGWFPVPIKVEAALSRASLLR